MTMDLAIDRNNNLCTNGIRPIKSRTSMKMIVLGQKKDKKAEQKSRTLLILVGFRAVKRIE